MSLVIKAISSLIITLLVSLGVSGMSETTPQEAAKDFFSGLSGDDSQTMELYMDNSYVNFLENVKGSDEDMDRLQSALFRNFEYKITDTAISGDVAVCRVLISNSDFSNVMDSYEKTSYDYVMKNLYDETVTDKEQLNSRCLDIYIDEIADISDETASKEAEVSSSEIFLPLEANGFRGWRVILSDEIMQTVLGGLQLPGGDE